MKRCPIFLLILSTLFTSADAESPPSVSSDKFIAAIEAAVSDFPELLARRYSHVDSMRSALLHETRPEQFSVGLRDMLSELETLSYDSLLVECDRFSPKVSSMRLDALGEWMGFKRAGIMAMRGAVREAIKSIDDLSESGIDPATGMLRRKPDCVSCIQASDSPRVLMSHECMSKDCGRPLTP